MKIEEMKAIAAARTKGEWQIDHNPLGNYLITSGVLLDKNFIPTGVEVRSAKKENVEFIAMAANNWDKLVAVVEAAKQLCGRQRVSNLISGRARIWLTPLEKTLEALEK